MRFLKLKVVSISTTGKVNAMLGVLWAIFAIAIALWLVGLAFHILGAAIHFLLVVAAAILLYILVLIGKSRIRN